LNYREKITLPAPMVNNPGYIRLDNSKLTPEFVEKIITDPEIQYSTTPQNILKYTDFMARVGTLKNKPATWQELFFPELHDRAGS
jgi:NitT/TauT family transport system substrate-binding protein